MNGSHLGRALLAVHHLDLASYAYSQKRGAENLLDAIEQCRRCQDALVAEAVRAGLIATAEAARTNPGLGRLDS